MTTPAMYRTDPIFAAVAEEVGSTDAARDLLIALGRRGYVLVEAAQAMQEINFADADVLVVRGYAAVHPGILTHLAARAGSALVIALPDDAILDQLDEAEMERAGWVRADRHARLRDEIDNLHLQLAAASRKRSA